MKKRLVVKAVLTAFVITVIYSMIPFAAICEEISGNVFRLHIVANSDDEADQRLKLKVRDRVLESTKEIFDDAESKSEAENLARSQLDLIQKDAQDEVYENGYSYNVTAEIVNMHFDTRHYEGYTLPAGSYDALRITIGNGEGHNWWCVMYPSICISTEDEGKQKARDALSGEEYEVVTDENIEYKFFIVELFQKIFS